MVAKECACMLKYYMRIASMRAKQAKRSGKVPARSDRAWKEM